ncbi:ECF-type sigma factor [Novipirellula artificiosorum]|uniref:RNA polymerase sigma factor n=1 Tax=Novipirellula artificiosorum TaxID=2528016 RepID=A0A5C6D1B9_9BACT|nr:ECF-type sigma factor [Novipirellula artificiosorum]TWU28996.1 RNA polymerase sigma factor [Novipirellula artificiosorum]
MNDEETVLTHKPLGEIAATKDLLPIVYTELRRMASGKLRREGGNHSLQTTGLVHEAYVRLVNENSQSLWQSRAHFFGAAAEAMRRILVDEARRIKSLKRGGDRIRVSGLSRISSKVTADDERILEVQAALDQLEKESPRRAQVVKMRFFASMTNEEIANTLGVSVPTVKRDWAASRVWIYRHLQPDADRKKEG